jgi:hypothetical protein
MDYGFAQKALRSRAARKDPAGLALMRQVFLAEFTKLDRKIGNHRLRTTSDYLVQKTLGDRLALLAQVEGAANSAIGIGDWTAQLVTLAVASRENQRLSEELMRLPVPAKLKSKERKRYVSLVAQKAKGFADKHGAIEQKLQAFWKNSAAFRDLSEQYAKATRPELRMILGREMKWIASVAPEGRRNEIQDDLKARSEVPSTETVASAIHDVRESPFSDRAVRHLRDIQADRGNDTWVTYLEARLVKMKNLKVAKAGDNP